MKTFQARFVVPVYNAKVVIVHSPDIHAARKKFDREFQCPGPEDACSAWVSYHLDRFGLFFQDNNCGLDTVSHELFHLTHRIMAWSGVADEEAGAILHEWICVRVFRLLRNRQWKS